MVEFLGFNLVQMFKKFRFGVLNFDLRADKLVEFLGLNLVQMFKKFRIGILIFENFYPLQWPIYALNSDVNTELPALLSHRRRTTVSSETYPLYIEDTYSVVNLESPLNVRLLM